TGPRAERLYADGARVHRFSASELAEFARQVEPEVNCQVRGTYTLSPAEVMTLITEWMASPSGADTGVALAFIVYGPSTPSPALLATEKYVARDSPEIWSWPIFPTGFHSEHLMELARLQAWTLKPAKRSE